MLAIKEMKKGKSPGPDELDIDTIKEAGEPLAKELTKLFNCCLECQEVLDRWRVRFNHYTQKERQKGVENY